jgi:hypothetical protein
MTAPPLAVLAGDPADLLPLDAGPARMNRLPARADRCVLLAMACGAALFHPSRWIGATLTEARRQAFDALARATARFDTTGAAAARFLRNLNNGEGSAGMLLRDPALYQRADQLLASLEDLIVDVKSNPKKYITVKVF